MLKHKYLWKNSRFLFRLALPTTLLLTVSAASAKDESLIIIDYQTTFDQEIEITLNGKAIFESKLPQKWMGSWIDNIDRKDSGLKRGTNELIVRYRGTTRDKKISPLAGPKTFKVEIKRQTDRKKPETAKLLATCDGPSEVKNGSMGTKKVCFKLP